MKNKIFKKIKNSEHYHELKIFNSKKESNFFSRLKWRLQFTKNKSQYDLWLHGRCITCAVGGKSGISKCSKYYCPCNDSQNLKLKKSRDPLFERIKKSFNFSYMDINQNQTIAL